MKFHLCLIPAGIFFLLTGLIRLGWLRHGHSPLDFYSLNWDWILQPNLPYWGVHSMNLARMLFGVACLLVGVFFFGKWLIKIIFQQEV